jgi:hypothetical protein
MPKRLIADLPVGPYKTPRVEEERFRDNSGPEVLPQYLRDQLAVRDHEGKGRAVEEFVRTGTIPPESEVEARQNIADWLIEQGLPEHIALVPATTMTVDLTKTAPETLDECLRNVPHLRELRLVGQPDTEASMAVAIEAALTHASLECLSLSGVGNDALGALYPALANNRSLKELHLEGHAHPDRQLSFHDGTALGQALENHPSLTSLSMTGCYSSATSPVSALLLANKSRLEELKMNNLLFTNGHAKNQWHNSVAQTVFWNRSLSVLSITGNEVSAKFLKSLGTALGQNVSLQKLALGAESQDVRGFINLLIEELQKNSSLTELSICSPMTHQQQEAVLIRMLVNKMKLFSDRLPCPAIGLGSSDPLGRAGPASAYASTHTSTHNPVSNSFALKNAMLERLDAGDHVGVMKLCEELRHVTILPSHMDELMTSADKRGHLEALLAAFNEVNSPDSDGSP